MKIIMMRGLPASGKTTKARELMDEYGNFVRVNRDNIRAMMHNGWSGKNEKLTVTAEKAIVKSILDAGYNVIVDDTNLGKKHEDMWRSITNELGAKFEIVKMDTPIDECIRRDAERDASVGAHVIWRFAVQYKLWRPKKGIVLCDIDGTVADLSHRLHYYNEKPINYEAFFGTVKYDKPFYEVIETVKDYHQQGYDIFFVSGRPEQTRKDTEEWLGKHGLYPHVARAVFMRGAHDRRKDDIVKEDILKIFDINDIHKVIDDRPSVIRMWRLHGLDVIDVGDGIEF